MIVLAIDSSSVAASAAVCRDDRIISEFIQNTSLTHSETLLPMIKSVLEAAGMTAEDIELFAVSAGPGSFTGVRIGISTIKGLAFGRNKPIASVSSLEALAYNLLGFNGIICPVMDARRGQFYTALFDGGNRLTPDLLIPYTQLKEKLQSVDKPIYFTGDAYALAHSAIDLPNVRKTPPRLRHASSASIAMCAQRNYTVGKDIFSDKNISPIYLRESQAERERKERLKQKNG